MHLLIWSMLSNHAIFESVNIVMTIMGSYALKWASLVAQTVKNSPVTQETWVQSLAGEDPLEEGMAALQCFVWRIPWTEEPGGLHSIGSQRVRQDWAANTMHWDAVWFRWLGGSHGKEHKAPTAGNLRQVHWTPERTPGKRGHGYTKSAFNTTRDRAHGSRDFRLLGWLERGGASGRGTRYPRGIGSLCRSSSERWTDSKCAERRRKGITMSHSCRKC